MGRTGRPTKLTPEVQDQLCKALRTGCSLRDAALLAGIYPSTLQRWLARGRAEQQGGYCDLREAVTRARCLWRAAMLAQVRRASKRDWRAAAWALERLGGRRYRRKDERRQAAPAPPAASVHIDLAPYAALIRTIPPGDLQRLPGMVV